MLLFPEQQRANNFNLCFNWFSPADNQRDGGEALSIRQMIAAVVEAHDIDASRIFVTGLSAGGAMTSILLASYPEVFAGGDEGGLDLGERFGREAEKVGEEGRLRHGLAIVGHRDHLGKGMLRLRDR